MKPDRIDEIIRDFKVYGPRPKGGARPIRELIAHVVELKSALKHLLEMTESEIGDHGMCDSTCSVRVARRLVGLEKKEGEK